MTDQVQKDDFLRKLSRFLEERKDGKGSWAPVTREEVTEMYNLLYEMLGLKYAEDCDGDLPIQIKIIDRTKFQSLHFFPMPHLPLDSNLAQVHEYLGLAQTNLSMAAEQVRIATVHIGFINEQEQKAKK